MTQSSGRLSLKKKKKPSSRLSAQARAEQAQIERAIQLSMADLVPVSSLETKESNLQQPSNGLETHDHCSKPVDPFGRTESSSHSPSIQNVMSHIESFWNPNCSPPFHDASLQRHNIRSSPPNAHWDVSMCEVDAQPQSYSQSSPLSHHPTTYFPSPSTAPVKKEPTPPLSSLLIDPPSSKQPGIVEVTAASPVCDVGPSNPLNPTKDRSNGIRVSTAENPERSQEILRGSHVNLDRSQVRQSVPCSVDCPQPVGEDEKESNKKLGESQSGYETLRMRIKVSPESMKSISQGKTKAAGSPQDKHRGSDSTALLPSADVAATVQVASTSADVAATGQTGPSSADVVAAVQVDSSRVEAAPTIQTARSRPDVQPTTVRAASKCAEVAATEDKKCSGAVLKRRRSGRSSSSSKPEQSGDRDRDTGDDGRERVSANETQTDESGKKGTKRVERAPPAVRQRRATSRTIPEEAEEEAVESESRESEEESDYNKEISDSDCSCEDDDNNSSDIEEDVEWKQAPKKTSKISDKITSRRAGSKASTSKTLPKAQSPNIKSKGKCPSTTVPKTENTASAKSVDNSTLKNMTHKSASKVDRKALSPSKITGVLAPSVKQLAKVHRASNILPSPLKISNQIQQPSLADARPQKFPASQTIQMPNVSKSLSAESSGITRPFCNSAVRYRTPGLSKRDRPPPLHPYLFKQQR